MTSKRLPFLVGLFLTTCSILQIEILCTRLLSVMTWYHLSFLAVSIAMLGMAAGAVRVYTRKDLSSPETAPTLLARYSTLFAASIPLCHVVNLCIPIVWSDLTVTIAPIVLTVAVLSIPFYLSGVVVAVALTRIPGPTGLVYSFDLAGAAAGALLVIPMLNGWSVSAVMLLCSGVAAGGALCFHVFAGTGRHRRVAALMVFLVACGSVNDRSSLGLRVVWLKGLFHESDFIVAERWTTHGQVIARVPENGQPPYWGRGEKAPGTEVSTIWMTIDGMAGTAMSRWDQQLESIEWTAHDVTALAYHLRQGADVAVIGVGGGRDLLTALWSRAHSVTGIEVNRAFLDLLQGELRLFAGLADRKEVVLKHDEARSFLTRTGGRFDVIQMSMMDSWAATGAGAFTLSENGLYTVEGWQAILGTLRPDGLFTVSRWYTMDRSSETARLVSLATAVLLEQGIRQPDEHQMLVGRDDVATLILSQTRFTKEDLDTISRLAEAEGFELLVGPDASGTDALLSTISRCRSREELDAAVAHDLYDQRPPTDERPFFFNILTPRGVVHAFRSGGRLGVVGTGNLIASAVLALLWLIVATLVVAIVVFPLLRFGRPQMSGPAFTSSVVYFALIGLGFMFVQIPLLQRFSVFLGHPTHALAVILFSMILFAGLGSLLSDRVSDARLRPALRLLPGLSAALLLAAALSLQRLIEGAMGLGLLGRSAVATLFVGIVALPLGMFFPLGLRAVRRISDDATPWLWGINGAAGVLAAVSAVAVSLWCGISVSLYIASIAYVLLLLPIGVLERSVSRPIKESC